MKLGRVTCSAITTALFALSVVFGASRAPAEDLDAISCVSPIVIAENSADVSEALEVACLASRAEASVSGIEDQAISTEATQSVPAADPVNDIRLWFVDASSLSAIEGQAIPIEVTQSVTVALLGDDIAERETDITDAVRSSVMATSPAVVSHTSVVILDPEE